MRKKILVLTPRFPYPVIGGDRLRIYELCKELSRYHDVSLLSLCETRAEMTYDVRDDTVFKNIDRVYLPKWQSYINVILALLTKTPLQVAYYQSQRYVSKLTELVRTHDLCIAHLIRSGEYVRNLDIPKILEMTDAISLNYRRVSQVNRGFCWRSKIYELEASRLHPYEVSVLSDFDLVSLVSQKDRSFLTDDQEPENVVVCTNGVNLSRLPFVRRTASEPVIVFIGNMSSVQNLDACYYFAEEVLPLLRNYYDCKFRVIGRIAQSEEDKLSKIDGVEVKSNVEDISAAVGNARIGVAPIRIGAGIQNKILEYFALGLPVITSKIGLEGIDAKPAADLLVAETAEDYLAHFRAIWEHPQELDRLADSGLKLVKNQHSWSAVLEPILTAVNDLPVRHEKSAGAVDSNLLLHSN